MLSIYMRGLQCMLLTQILSPNHPLEDLQIGQKSMYTVIIVEKQVWCQLSIASTFRKNSHRGGGSHHWSFL